MRLVFDTNVLISALLKPGSVPDRVLTLSWSRGVVAVYDERIAAEYTEVVHRKKFRHVPRPRVEALLRAMLHGAERLDEVPVYTGAMPDEDDRMFVEVALAGHADAIVTGNGKDFSGGLGVAVLTPAALLARLEAG